MNLFIIGNGFDRAHSLKTGYIDFRDFLYEEYPDFLDLFEGPYGNCIESNRTLVNEQLWKNFETNLCNIEEDFIVDLATNISLGLEGGDIDIEDTMMDYWEEQYGYIEHLKEYLYEWIRSIELNISAKTDYIKPIYDGEDDVTEDMFLTFNYTLVLEKIYKISSNNICHIHGSVDDEYDELVIGHGNREKKNDAIEKMYSVREGFCDKESSIYDALAIYYEKTEKDVEYHIANNKMFFNRLENVNNIYIIGHSLGEVDYPYFAEVKKNISPNTKWNYIFHDESQECSEKLDIIRGFGVENEMITTMSSKEFFNK